MKFKSISNFRIEARSIFEELEKEDEPFLIIQNSRPRGVLLSLETYEAMREALEEKEDVRAFDEAKKRRFEGASWDRYVERRLERRR